MSATLVKDFAALQEIMQHLSDIGVDVLPEQVTDGIYDTFCASKGYYKILLDDGIHYRWIRADNILEASRAFTSGSTGTGLTVGGTSTTVTATETLVGDVVSSSGELVAENIATTSFTDTSISATGLSTTASGAVAGDTAAAITLSPKTVVLCAVAGALGLEGGLVGIQGIVNAMVDTDVPFEWNPFTIFDEVITYITEDGKSYVPQELVENIYEWLYNNGYFDDATDHEGTWNNEQVPCMSLKNTAELAKSALMECYDQMDATSKALVESKVQEALNILSDPSYFTTVDTFDGLGGVTINIGHLSGYPASSLATSFSFFRSDSDIILSGSINNQGGSIIVDGPANGWVRSRDQGYPPNHDESFTWPSDHSLSESVQFSNGDGVTTTPSIHLTILNTGNYSDKALPKKPGAVIPVPGIPLIDQFLNWYNNRLYGDNEENGKPHDKTKDKAGLLPLGIPFWDPDLWSQSELQSGDNTDEDLDRQTKSQEDLGVGGGIPMWPPEDPIGDTPAILPPTSGSSTGLIKIYNPTLQSLANFSQWLWSSNIFDNFSKLLQDPMQAIIGLNLLYATPTRGTDSNIIVGNLNSNVSSRTVSDQYIHIDCGSVTVNRYYNNALDYIDTIVECFLPFIGIVRLNASDMIGKNVNIKASVDVLTGTVLYNIYVGTQLLYTFNGNCAVQLPLTSANYSSVITSAIGLAGGIGAAIASGGTLAPLAIAGAANMAGNMKHQVERSGNIGSNAGAMGVKKPYLIITRNKPYNPSAYNKFYGFPANSTVQNLSSVSGYTRVKDIRISGINATQTEIQEVEMLLKEGVIL